MKILTELATALLSIDFIHDIIEDGGKLAGKGYARFAAEHGTLIKLAKAQERFRAEGSLLVHVRVGFSANYLEHPAQSPLFGKAKDFGALQLSRQGTEFAAMVAPAAGEPVVVKSRVSAFYGTNLDLILRTQGIKTLLIAGVATDLAVEAAARDAHDRDYDVVVLSDCCAAASIEDHIRSLETIKKIGRVATLEDLD